jgi:hypothetical protein
MTARHQLDPSCPSAEGRSHWESYVVAAILKVRTRSRVGWLSKDVKGKVAGIVVLLAGDASCLSTTMTARHQLDPSCPLPHLTNSSRDCISRRKKSLGIIRSSGHFEGPDEVESWLDDPHPHKRSLLHSFSSNFSSSFDILRQPADSRPATLQTQAEIASAEGRSHWESYVVAAILKVRTRSSFSLGMPAVCPQR